MGTVKLFLMKKNKSKNLYGTHEPLSSEEQQKRKDLIPQSLVDKKHCAIQGSSNRFCLYCKAWLNEATDAKDKKKIEEIGEMKNNTAWLSNLKKHIITFHWPEICTDLVESMGKQKE